MLPLLLILFTIARYNSFIPTVRRLPIASVSLTGIYRSREVTINHHYAGKRRRRRSPTSSVNMYLGFDCDLYPQLSDLLYGASKADHCRTDVLSHTSEHFDLLGDLFLIICLLSLSYLSNRKDAAVNFGNINDDDDADEGDVIGRESDYQRYNSGSYRRGSDRDSKLVCPQCKGTRFFMNNACDLCEGKRWIIRWTTIFILHYNLQQLFDVYEVAACVVS